MRSVLLSITLAAVVSLGASSAAADTTPLVTSATATSTLQEPEKRIEITIGERSGSGVVWYRNPVWIAIGGLAAIVALLIVLLVVKGGGTTVIRE